jgi:hypothetical protein
VIIFLLLWRNANLSKHDPRHVRLPDAEQSTCGCLAHPLRAKFAYPLRLFQGHLGFPAVVASETLRCAGGVPRFTPTDAFGVKALATPVPTRRVSRARKVRPTLLHLIPHVVQRGSQEQVLRVHAKFHVAPVTDQKSVRDRTVRQFPRSSVGLHPTSAGLWYVAVTRTATGAMPQPAAKSRLLDSSPKTLCFHEGRVSRFDFLVNRLAP